MASRPAPPRPIPGVGRDPSASPPRYASAHASGSGGQRRPSGNADRERGGDQPRGPISGRVQDGSGMSGGGTKAIKVGQYELGQTLGVGSFGKVKLATHSVTGHKVAMKIINRRKILHMEMTSRVKREIQYLKLLRHPHIIKLYEVITTPMDIIMVIEYAGGELFNYIVDKGRMPEHEARRFFQQIICAIEYCHRHKIVHRDLKPENLLLDDYLNVKIGDFGLSNIMTDGDFLKTSCGSPNYAAPEVISGKVYAGPEIDIWSCGVILYVMLCGRLPFDDEYIPTLFKKINGGIYHLPSHLSPESTHILKRMLVVDPVRRATIAEIRSLPWFQQDLPDYLHPLPNSPTTEYPESTPLGELGAKLAAERAGTNGEGEMTAEQFAESEGLVYTDDLGIIEPEIVEELSEKMAGFDRSDVWDALRREGDNQIKVAYQLVRDHKRMLQDTAMTNDNNPAMDSFLGASPPAWNEGLEEKGAKRVQRNTSIKKRPTSNRNQEEEDDWDEEEGEIEDIPDSNFEVLDTSLPGRLDENGDPHPVYDVPSLGQSLPPAHTAAAAKPKQSRSRWHFGIRSRSPPMEVMHEIYKTLQVLNMQWKTKAGWDAEGNPSLGGGQGGQGQGQAQGQQGKGEQGDKDKKEKRQKDKQMEEKYNQGLFFVETRCRIDDVVVRMDLQLYRVDQDNYLVDFRNVGYYRTDSSKPGFTRVELDAARLNAGLNDPNNPIRIASPGGQPSATFGSGDGTSRKGSEDENAPSAVSNAGGQGGHGRANSGEKGESKVKDVSSPFLFFEVACRLIIELASG